MENKTKVSKIKISTIIIYIFLIAWAMTTIFPLIWSILNSFKDRKTIYSISFSLPGAICVILKTTFGINTPRKRIGIKKLMKILFLKPFPRSKINGNATSNK